jgi:protease PrsW
MNHLEVMGMLGALNKILLAVFLAISLISISISVLTLFLPFLIGGDAELEATSSMQNISGFALLSGPVAAAPADSPYEINLSVSTPALGESDLLSVDIYSEGRQLAHVNCFQEAEANLTGSTSLSCLVPVPYAYRGVSAYKLYAVLTREGTDYAAGPLGVTADWSVYEKNFWGFAWTLAMVIFAAYALILLPVGLATLAVAMNMRHNGSEGEYTLGSLFTLNGKGLAGKFHSFLVSPYFWAMELLGILIILIYMAISAEVWKSGTALVAFFFSGSISFIVPFLWCCAWWYADYREREPLRIMFSFFLWGMLAGLMAIGLNSLAGALLGIVGLGFFSTFLLAPPLEEFFKGSGLALLAEHHEYDSIEDGIVFGFTVGMGFSFIENWIYLLANPMGSDIWGWLFVFFLRAVFFSANHGFFTAITGMCVGYLIERGFRAPSLGLFIGVPVAAFFHAMHNSGETIIAFLGGGGALLYCCLLMPFFDYGGFILLVLLFIRSVLRKKGGGRP